MTWVHCLPGMCVSLIDWNYWLINLEWLVDWLPPIDWHWLKRKRTLQSRPTEKGKYAALELDTDFTRLTNRAHSRAKRNDFLIGHTSSRCSHPPTSDVRSGISTLGVRALSREATIRLKCADVVHRHLITFLWILPVAWFCGRDNLLRAWKYRPTLWGGWSGVWGNS